jgi:hypothetical protein
MRTTLKLQEEDQKTLRAIAQERGERGVARVVEEAVTLYLTERNRPAELAPAAVVPGRWQRMGAVLDQRLDELNEDPRVVSFVRLVLRGLRRFHGIANA